MNERIAVAVLAVTTLLSLWIAPWAAIARPTGARSSVVLLPYRFIDFSGRTDPLPIAGLTLVLWVSVVCLLVIAAAAFFKGQTRYRSWLLAGLVLLVATGWGLGNLQRAVRDVRVNLITTAIEEELADPRERTDVEALQGVLERVPNASIDATILKARQEAGFTIRRLGYGGSGMGLAAFLSFVVGGLAVFFGLRTFRRLERPLERILTVIAVPATSISAGAARRCCRHPGITADPDRGRLRHRRVADGADRALGGPLVRLPHAVFQLTRDGRRLSPSR